MRHYEFTTTTTMKEYNREKWWIDSDIIRSVIISAENLKAALKDFAKHCYECVYIEVSENALRTKRPMYIDLKSGETKQIGYVITGKTEFQRANDTWSTQYVDLWVRISEINYVDFDEEGMENYDD